MMNMLRSPHRTRCPPRLIPTVALRWRWALLAGLLWLPLHSAGQAGLSFPQQLELEIGRLAPTATAPATASAARARPSDPPLRRLYQLAQQQPLWTGQRAANAVLALELLRGAQADGLLAADYDTDTLASMLHDPQQLLPAELEVRLSMAMLRYVADLHNGRVAPAYPLPAGLPVLAPFDPVAWLAAAVRDGQLAASIGQVAPQTALYRRVKATLAQYRELAALPLAPLPRPAQTGGPAAGDSYADAGALAERLALLGDLEAGAASAVTGVYTLALQEALRRFQERHGIGVDGRLGPATFAALSVPLEHRVQQLELTLERLRWLPRLAPGPRIVVNLPAYHLWALDTSDPASPARLEMRVIVGKAGRSATPVFVGQLRHVEFNPYWNVPRSIALGEIAPKLARNPSYLTQHDMELVSADGQVRRLDGPAALAALRSGSARVRQRPGVRNVLGGVKFVMPNPMNIYLHSTSTSELFGNLRRDLSHGCIRVEQPEALAAFVLSGEPGWSPARVASALAPGPARVVPLSRPIPVLLFYATAVTRRDGRVQFANDIYGRDLALIRQLQRRRVPGR